MLYRNEVSGWKFGLMVTRESPTLASCTWTVALLSPTGKIRLVQKLCSMFCSDCTVWSVQIFFRLGAHSAAVAPGKDPRPQL